MAPDLSAEVRVSPAFHDVDPMWIVWHGHHVKYLELARSALLSRFDYDYAQMRDSGYAWPIVDLHVKYVRPVKFGEDVIVRAEIVEHEHRLKIAYRLRDAATGARIAVAHTVQVAVDMTTKELQLVCPRVLWQRLGVDPDSSSREVPS